MLAGRLKADFAIDSRGLWALKASLGVLRAGPNAAARAGGAGGAGEARERRQGREGAAEGERGEAKVMEEQGEERE